MKLSTEQLARMSRLLDEIIDMDATSREQWLRALPSEHRDLEPALRQGLLSQEGRAGGDDPAALLDKFRAAIDTRIRSGLQAGDLVGPYRLVRPLGAGGMAEVWLAQRADGAFRRDVALKIPAHLERRKDLAERFAIERDILAALEHPHIARFYDAGVSADGRPYLALEYVAGENLLRWADQHRLAIRARIDLFLQVLAAVAYAHGKGVLHRDIKPGNVLVTETGQAILLDFGVAKIVQPTEDADADLTRVYGQALTPGYASPEQFGRGPVDAASDVYSLGVVLYELLSERRPHETGDSGAVKPPSGRLDAAAAELRGGSVARIARLLKGDLDAIVLKALAQSPPDRYPGAAAFSQDLRSWLAGEPVAAVPNSLPYRAGKFVTRNPAGVGLAVALAAAVIGIGYALLQDPQSVAAPAAEQASTPNAPPAAPLSPANRSLAVLPFADLSDRHDQQYFADGLSEALIDRLSANPGLRVIARTSAFAFKGTNADVRAIAAALGVSHLLTGSVRRNGSALRVEAALVRAADGNALWSRTYERDLADLFKVQDEIAATIAHALQGPSDRRAQHASRQPSVEAYNLVLQGDVYSNGPFKRDAERAEVLFRKAAAVDPSYALPWVKLGLLYMKEARLSWAPKDDANAQARQAIESALQIDPESMAARAALFRYLVGVEHRWADARAELDRMRTININDALILPECEAYFAGVTGNLDEAIKIQRQILDRDPLNSSAIGTLGLYLFQSDRLEESLALFHRELQLNPHAAETQSLIGVALALLGRGEEALAVIAQERQECYRLWAFSAAFWTLGRQDESDAALKMLLARFPQASPYFVARLYALREQRNQAFEWLDRACVERQSGCEMLKIDRFFRSLRDEPRFQALLAKMKLGGDPRSSAR